MSTRPYVVRQGDYLAKLAGRLGFDPDEVRLHADNRALRDAGRRPDILHPGDVLHLPVHPEGGALVAARSTNRYRAHLPTVEIRIRLLDARDTPLVDRPFQVRGSGPPRHGRTDSEGVATFRVGTHLHEVTLTLEDTNEQYRVTIGTMDPLAERSGVEKRLANLGHLAAGGDLAEALRSFQRARGLEASGELDAPTREALLDAHGS